MKYKIIIIGLTILMAAVNAKALENKTDKFGLGLMLGEPTGLSLKYWIDDIRGIDGAFAWSLSDDGAFQLHSDYLINNHQISNSEQWPVYYGLGARIMFNHDEGKHHDDKIVFGFRVPLGISYLFEEDMPYEFFFEIAPILDVAPKAELNVNASVGLRFYF
jgi:hypothetical protein